MVTLASCLFGLHTTLWGQEPNDVNDIEELKTIIAKLEKQIEQQESKIRRLREELRAGREELRAGKEELQVEKEENKRLIKICREAGINVEKTESPTQADYEVCTTPIEPNNILSDSMETLGFTALGVGALGWISYFPIEQIIDANNAIVTIRMVAARDPTYEEIKAHKFDVTVWLKGVQTKGRADNTLLKVNHYFAVTGTKTYDTAIGSHTTLYVIEPVILSPKRLKQETLRYEERKRQLYGQRGSQKKKGMKN